MSSLGLVAHRAWLDPPRMKRGMVLAAPAPRSVRLGAASPLY